MKFLTLSSLIMILAFSSCATNKSSEQDRVVANEVDQKVFEYYSQYEDDFRKNFKKSQAMSTSKSFNNNSSDHFGVEVLKQGIGKSFYYMYRFDEKLDQAVAKCSQEKCDSPINSDEYRKLQVYRSINEELKDKFTYYYMRLLDLATYEDDSLNRVFEGTKKQMQDEQEVSLIAMDARAMLLSISQKAQDGLNANISRDPLDFYLATVLSEIREKAETIFYPAAGDFGFKSKQATSFTAHHNELISENFSQAMKSYSKNNKSKDLPMYFEIMKEVDKNSDRYPQGAWKNHTGRSFKAGDWALTYDDGPRTSTTNQILNILEDKGWHATFFWQAKNALAQENRSVIGKAKKLGMSLASHSYTHADLGKSSSNLQKEIVDAKRVLESIYGTQVNFFRLPYGSGTRSSRVKNVITSLNMEHFFWNVDSLDWQDPSPRSIYNRIVKQMKVQGRGIILVHDIHQKTVEVTKLMAKNLKNDVGGIRIIKLEDGADVGTANGEIQREPRDPSSFPYDRRITASKLNVRSAPVSGSVCATLANGSVIEVLSQDSNSRWYSVNLRDIQGGNSCGSSGYISNSSSYSAKN